MPLPSPLSQHRLDEWIDPTVLFRTFAAHEADLYWLDAGDDATEGWSVLGLGERESDPHSVGETTLTSPSTGGHGEPPFAGGWIGWLDYESGALAAGAPIVQTADKPCWLRMTKAIAFDHERRSIWLLASADRMERWGSEVRAAVDLAGSEQPVSLVEAELRAAEGRHSPHRYAALIEQCRAEIRAGNVYQLCLTTAFTVQGQHDAVQTYLRLRAATPAHHGGFIRIGDRALLSASPEQFLHARNGRVQTRPIKGTRPRGRTPDEDRALATELVQSEKERAENVMIVDLMRNDLSQVCAPGSIRVDGLWEVESYPAVHQLVSTVSGEISPGASLRELWNATFPAGSMTGAPKISAMSVLHGLERSPRGIYSGVFGHVGIDGTVDLAMTIRSIVITPHSASVGAGGGITWQSDAAAEVVEVATKAAAGLRSLGSALPEDWKST